MRHVTHLLFAFQIGLCFAVTKPGNGSVLWNFQRSFKETALVSTYAISQCFLLWLGSVFNEHDLILGGPACRLRRRTRNSCCWIEAIISTISCSKCAHVLAPSESGVSSSNNPLLPFLTFPTSMYSSSTVLALLMSYAYRFNQIPRRKGGQNTICRAIARW